MEDDNNKKLSEEEEKKKQEALENISDEFAFKQKCIEDFKANTAAMEWLNGYNTASADGFLKDYAREKWMWHRYGPMYQETKDSIESRWIDTAHEHLKYILQKKLFDLQCQWRAEKIELPGIEICYDFEMWEKDIFNCPALEPITEDELNLYIEFLQSNNADADFENLNYIEWQDYDDVKYGYESDNEEGYFPEWYDFHNGRTGSGVLMQLSDIRGEKEEFYRDIYRENQRKINAEKQAELEATQDKRPFLHVYDRKIMDFFVSTFEDRKTQSLYKAYVYRPAHLNTFDNVDNQRLSDAVDMLLDAQEMIPIESNINWKDAVIKAATLFECRQIAEALPVAWEQYIITVQNRFGFTSDISYKSIRDMWYNSIIQGRILNGEPGDLNF